MSTSIFARQGDWLEPVAVTYQPNHDVWRAAMEKLLDEVMEESWLDCPAEDGEHAGASTGANAPVEAEPDANEADPDANELRLWAMFRGESARVPDHIHAELLERDPWWRAHPGGDPRPF